MNLDGLDLPSRSAALGFSSCAEYVRFCNEHPDLAKVPLSAWLVARVRRHDDAGRPSPDFTRLVYIGSGTFRACLMATLKKLPAWFAWHCVEWIVWLEVGSNACGWMACAPLMRAPLGDTAHLIVIDGTGTSRPESWEHTIVHEASHSVHKLIIARAEESVPMPEEEWLARRLLVSRMDEPAAAAALARELYFHEQLADATASALGFPPTGCSSSIERLRGFQAAIAAVAPLADEIERDLETNNYGTDTAARAAATEGAP